MLVLEWPVGFSGSSKVSIKMSARDFFPQWELLNMLSQLLVEPGQYFRLARGASWGAAVDKRENKRGGWDYSPLTLIIIYNLVKCQHLQWMWDSELHCSALLHLSSEIQVRVF